MVIVSNGRLLDNEKRHTITRTTDDEGDMRTPQSSPQYPETVGQERNSQSCEIW